MSVTEYATRLRARPDLLEEALERKGEFGNWKIRAGEFYDDSFGGLIRKHTLSELTEALRVRSGTSFVLDLLGYGHVLRRLPIDRGLAVALADPRHEYEKERDEKNGIELITGNVVRGKTWKKMRRWIESRGGEDAKFNLILCRPVAGMDGLTENRAVHAVLLQRAWQLLSPDCGTLLTQIPHPEYNRNASPHLYRKEPEFSEWIKMLNQVPGVRIWTSFEKPKSCRPRYFRPSLLLVKNPGAPERLPFAA